MHLYDTPNNSRERTLNLNTLQIIARLCENLFAIANEIIDDGNIPITSRENETQQIKCLK